MELSIKTFEKIEYYCCITCAVTVVIVICKTYWFYF